MIGISKSKLNNSTVLDPEIYTENYEILLFDRNWHGGGVTCYIRSDISYKLNSFRPNEIENNFNISMARTKQITIGIIYRLLKSIYLIFLKRIYQNSTQPIVKFTSWAISTLIFLKTEISF